MGIPAGLTRVTFSGTLSSVEHWACSFFFTGGTAAGTTDAGAAAFVSGTAFPALITAVRTLLAGDDTWDSLDLYYYDGGTAAVAHGHAAVTATGLGGTGLPKQTACVLTLRTALANRSGRGRMYFPCTGGVMTTGGKITTTARDALVDAMGNWFASFTTGTIYPVVASQTHTSFQKVTSVDADNLPDTQRGRRGKLVGARHSHSV
jgi:hypothetical protein